MLALIALFLNVSLLETPADPTPTQMRPVHKPAGQIRYRTPELPARFDRHCLVKCMDHSGGILLEGCFDICDRYGSDYRPDGK
jgi:hypothetical protein